MGDTRFLKDTIGDLRLKLAKGKPLTTDEVAWLLTACDDMVRQFELFVGSSLVPVAECKVKIQSYVCPTYHKQPTADDPSEEVEYGYMITGIQKVDEGLFDFKVQFPLLPESTYYLLSVFYDTGDSFKREYKVVEHLDLFESYSDAREIAAHIARDAEEQPDSFSLEMRTNGGTKYKISTPWKGYFETFREARVTPIRMGPESFTTKKGY